VRNGFEHKTATECHGVMCELCVCDRCFIVDTTFCVVSYLCIYVVHMYTLVGS